MKLPWQSGDQQPPRERPEDVFTPSAPVRDDMYAARVEGGLEEQVESALAQPGRQLVVYGDTGVGKTSTIEFLARRFEYRYHRVEFGRSLEDILRGVLADLGYDEEVGTVERKTTTRGGKIGVEVIGASTGSGAALELSTAPVPGSLVTAVIDALEENDFDILFMDNYENALTSADAETTQRQLAQLMKTLADRARGGEKHLKAVVAGIPSASEELVKLDPATSRRTEQIEVGRMPRVELHQILDRGAEKLGMRFSANVARLIVAYSDGFPYYTHLLALHASLRALRRGSDEITDEDFEGALDAALAGCMLELRSRYQRAAETSGKVKARRSIMEAMASQRPLEVSFKSIREGFVQLHPGYRQKQLNFLSYAIKELKAEGILSDKDRPKSPNNLYRFTNPLMRGYVRLRVLADKRAQLTFWNPDDPEDERPEDEASTTTGATVVATAVEADR